jgi:hypothetical protein
MPNDVMLIIIRQIKSMPKHFCAKEELCRKTVMLNDIMPNDIMRKILMQLKGIPKLSFAGATHAAQIRVALKMPLTALTFDMDCEKTAMGLPASSAVFLMIKFCCLGPPRHPLFTMRYLSRFIPKEVADIPPRDPSFTKMLKQLGLPDVAHGKPIADNE